MTTAYANVDGATCLEVRLIVPRFGPWWADLTFEDEAQDVEGSVTLTVGDVVLSGTIDPEHDGTFGLQRTARIVGGGNGWREFVSAQHYHNDAGVTARTVADDAARLAGEEIGNFDPELPEVGIDYVRQSGVASRVLEDVIGDRAWWVGYDGRTNVGERAESTPIEGTYQVLQSSPDESLVTLGVDDISSVEIGSVLSEGLTAPLTVRELDVRVSVDAVRVIAWGGSEAGRRGRLAGIVRSIVRRAGDDRLFGKYRYRVVRMSGNRTELQAVATSAGLPDILPISMRPGVAGAHAKLTGGSVVLVEFIEGKRTMPIVVAFAGKDEEGDVPQELDFSVAVTMRLGSDAASEGATLGTSHKSWADGHKHGYIDSQGTAATPVVSLTDVPQSGVPPTLVADPSPDPSSKVFVE